ncbi:hypothetical protein D3C83_08920 [compost metagenome]
MLLFMPRNDALTVSRPRCLPGYLSKMASVSAMQRAVSLIIRCGMTPVTALFWSKQLVASTMRMPAPMTAFTVTSG